MMMTGDDDWVMMDDHLEAELAVVDSSPSDVVENDLHYQ